MDPFTNPFTLTTSSSNDSSNYPGGQFIDPALLQLDKTASSLPNRSHQQAAEMAWNPPGLFQTQNPFYLSGSSPFGSRNDHTLGNVSGTTAGPSTASRPMPPQASAPHTTMPAYSRSEGYVPPSLRNLLCWSPNVRGHLAPFHAPRSSYMQYQLPTPGPTPAASTQVDYNTFTGYDPLLSYCSTWQPQPGPSALGMGYTSLGAGSAGPTVSSLPRRSQGSFPLAHVVTTPRGQDQSYLPTSFPLTGIPSEYPPILSQTQTPIVPSMGTPSSFEARNGVGKYRNTNSFPATQPHHANTRATEPSSSRIRDKKPYTRRMKKVDAKTSARLGGGHRPSFRLPRVITEEVTVEAPPSPKISVKIVKIEEKPRTSTATDKVQKDSGCNKKWVHVFSGLGPDAETFIQAIGPARPCPLLDRTPQPAKDGDWYRCRWDQCCAMVQATREGVLAHLRTQHDLTVPPKRAQPSEYANSSDGIHSSKIACSWHPALPVKLGLDGEGGSEIVFISSHEHSYKCGRELAAISVVNHIGTHLRYERQPNPMAAICACGKAVMIRGSHKCPYKNVAKKRNLKRREC